MTKLATGSTAPDEARRRQVFESVSALGAAATAAAGGAVLFGWLFDVAWLRSVRPGLASMKANTALLFLVAGMGVICLRHRRQPWRTVGRASGWIVAIVAAATLSQYVLGTDYGIDELFVRDPGSSILPGRMAPATAAGLLCCGLALLTFDKKGGRRASTSAMLGAITVAIAWIALTGYFYDIEALYRVGSFSSMAVHTAALLLVLGLAIITGQPRTGVIAVATGDSAGSAVARRLIPLVPICFLLAGWLWLTGQRFQLYSASFALALTVVSTTVFSVVIMARYAALLDRADLARRAAHDQMVAATTSSAHRRFEALLEAAPDAMVIVDKSGGIVLVNAQTERMFGYRRDELLGRPVEVLIPSRLHAEHALHRAAFAADPRNRPMGANLMLYAQRKNGAEFPVEVSLSPLATDEGLLISSAVRDVTARRQAEETLRRSLDEKDTLLREVHHRVKNNLAVIASLLYLESRSATAPEAVSLFQEARDRVQSMALVHETLYRSSSFAGLDFEEYLRGLLPQLVRTYAADGRIGLHVDANRVRLALDTAVPCALMINELVTNSLKHGFCGGRRGVIDVSLVGDGDGYVLRVADDGVGIAPDLDISRGRSLGLRLVTILAEQLAGQFTIRPRDRGSEAIVTFPKLESI